MGRLSAAQLAEFTLPAITAVPLLEFDLPDGTTHRMSFRPVPAAAYYHPRLASLSPLQCTLDLEGCQLSTPEMTAEVVDSPDPGDTVGWFSRISATYRGALYDAPVRIKAASTVTEANWLLAYTGRMISWARRDNGIRELVFRPLDAQLQAPLRVPKVRADDWPNAHPDALNLPLCLPYGICSDRGTSGTMAGAITARYVDTVGYRYAVCPGWVYEGQEVYVGGTRAISGFVWSYVTVNGRRFTLIDFAADKADAVITCNVKGYESVGDRSGTFLAHPVDQALHFLVNWVFGYSESGVWGSATGLPVDATSFTAAKASLAGRAGGCEYVTGKVLTEEQQCLSLFNAFCDSAGLPPYWTPAGAVALFFDDPHQTAKLYAPDAMYRKGMNVLGVSYPTEGSEVIRTQGVTWEGGGEVRVTDLNAPGTGEAGLDMSWGRLTDI